jgi:hypothetical protein
MTTKTTTGMKSTKATTTDVNHQARETKSGPGNPRPALVTRRYAGMTSTTCPLAGKIP